MANCGIKEDTVPWRVKLYRGVCGIPVVATALAAIAGGLIRTMLLPYVASDWSMKVNQER